jgi:hypothetical protein
MLGKLNMKFGVVVNNIIDRNTILINEDTYFEQYISFADLFELFERIEG